MLDIVKFFCHQGLTDAAVFGEEISRFWVGLDLKNKQTQKQQQKKKTFKTAIQSKQTDIGCRFPTSAVDFKPQLIPNHFRQILE